MKKQKRNAERFEVLELFAEMGLVHGYKFDDTSSLEDFITRINNSIASSSGSDITVFGKRVESLFGFMVGALGNAIFVKQEDNGDVYTVEDKVSIPDYFIALKDGTRLLIEVKNFHNVNPRAKFKIKKSYYSQLRYYADLRDVPLKIAVYFSIWNIWTLLDIDNFEEGRKDYSISFTRAIVCSEMGILGDCNIAVPFDLELEFRTDPENAPEFLENTPMGVDFQSIRFYCAGQEVASNIEQNIMFNLIRFGDWSQKNSLPIIENNRLIGIKVAFTPESKDNEKFAVIGSLSKMVTNAYKQYTIENESIVSIKIGLDPTELNFVIPVDYQSDVLPLWRFYIRPNPNFIDISS